VAVLVIGGGVAAFLLTRSSEEAVVASAGSVKPTEATVPAPEPVPEPATEAAPPPPEPEAAKPPETSAEKPKPKIREVDLSQVADLEPDPGASPEMREEIDQLVRTMLDPDSGAAGSRAMTRLAQIGLPAMPAILNAAKQIDYATPEGNQVGGFVFVALLEKRMTSGKGFGYHAAVDEDSVKRNRLIVEAWIRHIREKIYSTPDPKAAWDKFAALQTRSEEEPAAEPAAAPKKKPADDLGLGDVPK
jgi:hypothetical protein